MGAELRWGAERTALSCTRLMLRVPDEATHAHIGSWPRTSSLSALAWRWIGWLWPCDSRPAEWVCSAPRSSVLLSPSLSARGIVSVRSGRLVGKEAGCGLARTLINPFLIGEYLAQSIPVPDCGESLIAPGDCRGGPTAPAPFLQGRAYGSPEGQAVASEPAG